MRQWVMRPISTASSLHSDNVPQSRCMTSILAIAVLSGFPACPT